VCALQQAARIKENREPLLLEISVEGHALVGGTHTGHLYWWKESYTEADEESIKQRATDMGRQELRICWQKPALSEAPGTGYSLR